MPEENKPESENKEQTLNEVAEELKKVGNVITDGINKLEEKTESNNLELKNLSSSITEVKESVNHISLTTDSSSEIQTQQIESLKSLVEETKQNREEIKGAIDKQIKEQSKISKKQMKLMTATNTELKATNKGFKKLSKSINDLDVGGDRGGGGGILSLLAGGLSSLVAGVLGAVVGVIGPLMPLLLPAIAAGAGALIYKLFIEPYLNEMKEDAEKVLGIKQKAGEQIKGSTGEKMFAEVDKKGEATGKVLTESEVKQKISSADTPEKKQEEETKYIPLSTSVTSTGEARQSVSLTIVDPSLQGASKEELEKAIQEKKAQAIPDMTVKAKLSEDQKKQRIFYIKKYQEEIIDFDNRFRKQIEDFRTLRMKKAEEDPVKWELGGAQQFIAMVKVGADTLLNEHISIIKRLKKSVDDGFITKEDSDNLLNNISPGLFKADWLPDKSQIDTSMVAIRYPLPSDGFFTQRGEELFTGPDPIGRTPLNPGNSYIGTDDKRTADSLLYEIIGQPAKQLDNNYIKSIEQQSSEDNKPKANNGAILTGPQKGYNVELHGTEAVINPKSPQGDQVTGAIAKNLVEEITDVKSIPKESIMIQDGLSRSKNEHYDMTVAQPLSSSGQGTSVVNNIVGGGTSDSRRDPNSQFNPSMLLLNNTETVSQQVLMEIKKAELL